MTNTESSVSIAFLDLVLRPCLESLLALWRTTLVTLVLFATVDDKDPLFAVIQTDRAGYQDDMRGRSIEWRAQDGAVPSSIVKTQTDTSIGTAAQQSLERLCHNLTVIHNVSDSKHKNIRKKQQSSTNTFELPRKLATSLIDVVNNHQDTNDPFVLVDMLSQLALRLEQDLFETHFATLRKRRQSPLVESFTLLSRVCLSTSSCPRLGLVDQLRHMKNQCQRKNVGVTKELIQQCLDQWIDAGQQSTEKHYKQGQNMVKFNLTMQQDESMLQKSTKISSLDTKRLTKHLFGFNLNFKVEFWGIYSILFQSNVTESNFGKATETYQHCFNVFFAIGLVQQVLCDIKGRQLRTKMTMSMSTIVLLQHVKRMIDALTLFFGLVVECANKVVYHHLGVIGRDATGEQQEPDIMILEDDNDDDYRFDQDDTTTSESSFESFGSSTSNQGTHDNEAIEQTSSYSSILSTVSRQVSILQQGFFLSSSMMDFYDIFASFVDEIMFFATRLINLGNQQHESQAKTRQDEHYFEVVTIKLAELNHSIIDIVSKRLDNADGQRSDSTLVPLYKLLQEII
ncbi:hypothetical protein OIO90_006131 [Microbotryomycetes sp. JL221]|nr:hypothetical protein OIO90_006131 [Microbotryomycetes sp. JL221]